MYNQKERKPSQSSFINFVGWTLSLGFLATHVFHPLRPESVIGSHIYVSIFRELWAASICWIVYACHQLNSGGVIREFLSSAVWQPLSKICLSTYLIHYIYLSLAYDNQKELSFTGAWWRVHTITADVFISFVLGAIFYLVVEAPTGRLVKLCMNRNYQKLFSK